MGWTNSWKESRAETSEKKEGEAACTQQQMFNSEQKKLFTVTYI